MAQKLKNDDYISGVPREIQPIPTERRKVNKGDVVYTGIYTGLTLAYFGYRIIDKAVHGGGLLFGIVLTSIVAASSIYLFWSTLKRYRNGEEIETRWFDTLRKKQEK